MRADLAELNAPNHQVGHLRMLGSNKALGNVYDRHDGERRLCLIGTPLWELCNVAIGRHVVEMPSVSQGLTPQDDLVRAHMSRCGQGTWFATHGAARCADDNQQ